MRWPPRLRVSKMDIPGLKDYAASIRVMKDEDFMETVKYEEQQHRAKRDMAHPEILKFSDAMVSECKKLDIPLFPACIVRDRGEQRAMYAMGRSNNDGSGPYPHEAFAVDLVHGVRGWNLDSACWDVIGHIGAEISKRLSIPIRWGGDWDWNPSTPQRLYDPAHWELAYWRTLDPHPPFMHKRFGQK